MLACFRSVQKCIGPKSAGSCFPTILDLANILGMMNLDFDMLLFLYLDPNNPRFPNSRAGPHPCCCNISIVIGIFQGWLGCGSSLLRLLLKSGLLHMAWFSIADQLSFPTLRTAIVSEPVAAAASNALCILDRIELSSKPTSSAGTIHSLCQIFIPAQKDL